MKEQAKKIKRILVAIDFSSHSRQALEYAVEVAGITNARIVAINIINQTEIDSVEKDMNSKYPNTFSLAKHLPPEIGRRQLKLEALAKEVIGPTQLPIEIRIGHGRPHVEILKAIDQEAADFLVFGSKGETNLHEFLFGSVAEKLFRHSPVPVLSLRPPST